jgi:hypothetical protein
VSTLVEILTVVIAALVSLSVVVGLPSPPRRKRVGGGADDGSAIPRLMRLDRAVLTGTRSAGSAHRTLRPILRSIARHGLLAHGIDTDRDREEARALLGDPLWTLTRPDVSAPADPRAAGFAVGELEASLERLEDLYT